MAMDLKGEELTKELEKIFGPPPTPEKAGK
jgi:hypothetical protein